QSLLCRRALMVSIGSMCAIIRAPSALAQNPAEEQELPAVEVIGTTPLPGLETPIQYVPSNVQVHTSKDLNKQRQSNLAEYLEQNPTSVTINAAQGNPFQPNISYRGFTASPLLGLPQGLSVFQDGVRINEPFGDVVNWYLIPQSAISSIHLSPGSNPVFGLNTLGGVLTIQTKSGFAFPGTALRLAGGAFGRRSAEEETGGHGEHADYFAAVNLHNEEGWSEQTPCTLSQ